MRWRANFFKDLVSSDGRSSSTLQRSIEISGAKNVDRALEAAKRRYESLCGVPIWWLYADRLELESKGQTISYRPTHDEIALTRIPGRNKEFVRNARGDLHY
jgi:threonine synthase